MSLFRLGHADFWVRVGTGFLGGVLILAAVLKAVQPEETTRTVAQLLDSLHMSTNVTPVIAVCCLVGVEWILGSLIISRIVPIGAMACGTVLFVFFAACVIWLLVTEAPVGCGCGLASSNTHVALLDVARTGVFALIAGAVLIVEIRQWRGRCFAVSQKEVVS